jgi:hypothetical protein
MDVHNRGYVSKLEVARFLKENDKIIELYDLRETKIDVLLH